MKRRDQSKISGLATHASPGVLEGQFPNLATFLTCALYDDGSRREAPTLTLWCQGGQWKLSVKDRAEALVMWLSAAELIEVVQLAEMFCLEEEAPWRQDEYGSPEKGKRTNARLDGGKSKRT